MDKDSPAKEPTDVDAILKHAFSNYSTTKKHKTQRLRKVTDPATGKPLTPHKLRIKEVAIAASEPGVSYAEVGERFYPNTAHPRQTVYRSVHSPTAQAELQRIEAKLLKKADVTVDSLLNELDEATEIARKKERADWLASTAMDKAKLAGLLKETPQTTQNFTINMPPKRALPEVAQFRVENPSENVPQSSEDQSGEANAEQGDNSTENGL